MYGLFTKEQIQSTFYSEQNNFEHQKVGANSTPEASTDILARAMINVLRRRSD